MKRKLIVALSFALLHAVIVDHVVAQSKSGAREKEPLKEPALITFIELGSVKCIPCKMMQPVMKSIEEKYGSQIDVVFYDVWTRKQSQYAQSYKIRVIPTQVFLDKKGTEVFRHEGFFPEAEIDTLLQKRGLKAKGK